MLDKLKILTLFYSLFLLLIIDNDLAAQSGGISFTDAEYARAHIDVKFLTSRPSEISREEWFNQYLKRFTESIKQSKRVVIFPPELTDQERSNWLLEVTVGRKEMIQPCGEHMFFNKFTISEIIGSIHDKKNLNMPFYKAELGEMDRSVLFCSKPREEHFVKGRGARFRVEYDLPFVFYIPKDSIANYRFWQTNSEFKEALPFRDRYIVK